MWNIIFFVTLITADNLSETNGEKRRECSPRKLATLFPTESIYCVCNSTYCDDAPKINKPNDNSEFIVVSSSRGGLRFSISKGNFQNIDKEGDFGLFATIEVNPGKTYQEILGFGSSTSDSAGINIKSLSEEAQEELLKSYFSPDGLEYNIIRVPMGSTDFSLRNYSYAMTRNDPLLKNFSLAEEDLLYKIPYLQKAIKLNEKQIRLIASPWSASPWMKTNNDWTGAGSLKREYWQSWANYFVKFFQEYRKHGISFWALTPQNEPLIGFLQSPINAMAWSPWDQRDWVVQFLSPILEEAGFRDVDIITGDGVRHLLPDWPREMMKYPESRKLISGTGVHWYLDSINPVEKLDATHDLFPEKYILYTESCAGAPATLGGVSLGSWSRAELYAKSIIETISHWVAGWVDWNMALDLRGGPNWVNNYVDSPIIVNSTADEFYKQPTFYVMGHFSKYVTPGSLRIATSKRGIFGVSTVAFRRPDNATVIILLNTYSSNRIISLTDITKGKIPSINLPPKSIHTLIYW